MNEVRRILVADDDDDIRRMLVRALEPLGHTLETAADGQAALDRCAHAWPDLILLDLMMPVMDGFEFALALRRNDAWATVPVIVITAKDISEDERRALNGGVEAVLRKSDTTSDQLLRQSAIGLARWQ